MSIRNFALAYGIVFLAIGIAGFVPPLVTPSVEGAAAADGRLLGLFPINALHNIVHIAFGVWGLAVFRSLSGARVYARAVAVIYGLLTIMGLIPGLQTTFGLIPLYGHDVWLHAVLAVVAAYFGWMARVDETPAPARY